MTSFKNACHSLCDNLTFRDPASFSGCSARVRSLSGVPSCIGPFSRASAISFLGALSTPVSIIPRPVRRFTCPSMIGCYWGWHGCRVPIIVHEHREPVHLLQSWRILHGHFLVCLTSTGTASTPVTKTSRSGAPRRTKRHLVDVNLRQLQFGGVNFLLNFGSFGRNIIPILILS